MSEKPDGVHPRMEKYILRKAFDVEPAYLPASVLWRQKEQFSDGVGYDWVDGLKAYAQQARTCCPWPLLSSATSFLVCISFVAILVHSSLFLALQKNAVQ